MVTCSSRNLYDPSHDASRAPVYRTLNYERNHGEESAAQEDARRDGQYNRPRPIQAIIGSEVIPRELSRRYFAGEKSWEFVIEALLFAIIVGISAWPVFAAADALNQFLQRSAS